MKKLFFFLLTSSLLLQSCATIIGGTKKNIFLIDLPNDLAVTKNKESLEVKQQLVGSSSSGNTRTRYMYPGVRMKMKKGIKLELKSGSKTVSVPVKSVVKTGDVIMSVIFNIPTFEIGLIVDILSGALKTPKERFIDVPAVLEKRTPRSQKELHIISRGG